jgi:hypothetical protein
VEGTVFTAGTKCLLYSTLIPSFRITSGSSAVFCGIKELPFETKLKDLNKQSLRITFKLCLSFFCCFCSRSLAQLQQLLLQQQDSSNSQLQSAAAAATSLSINLKPLKACLASAFSGFDKPSFS